MSLIQNITIVMQNSAFEEINNVLQKYCLIPSSIEKVENSYYVVKFNEYEWCEEATDEIIDTINAFKCYGFGFGFKFLYADAEEDIQFIETNTYGNRLFKEYTIEDGKIVTPNKASEVIVFKPLSKYNDLACKIKKAVYDWQNELNTDLFKLELSATRDDIEGETTILYNIILGEEYVRVFGNEIDIAKFFKKPLTLILTIAADGLAENFSFSQCGDTFSITAKKRK